MSTTTRVDVEPEPGTLPRSGARMEFQVPSDRPGTPPATYDMPMPSGPTEWARFHVWKRAGYSMRDEWANRLTKCAAKDECNAPARGDANVAR